MKLKVLAFRLATRLMAYSGDVGSAEWSRMTVENSAYKRRYVEIDNEFDRFYSKHKRLVSTIRLVDGMLSQKQYDFAQEQLRIAIIEGGESFGRTDATNKR